MQINWDQEETYMINFLKELVQQKSENPPGDEIAAAQVVKKRLEDLGLEVKYDVFNDQRANVVARIKGAGTKPSVLFNGHLDVVPPGKGEWEHNPYGGEIIGDKIYGRGTSDMKSGIVAMIAATKAVLESNVPLEGDVTLAFTAGEETDSIGAHRFMEQGGLERVGSIVISEPSDLDIVHAEKGTLWLKFTTLGKTAHGARPKLGNNAILHMHKWIDVLQQYSFKYEDHYLLGKPTMSIGTISGGVKTNVVPDECSLTVDIRTVPGQNHNDIVEDMKKLVRKIRNQGSSFKAEVNVLSTRPSVETPKEAEIVTKAHKILSKLRKEEPKLKGANGYTEASVFVPHTGLPWISCGPGLLNLAHQPNEYVPIPSVKLASEFYAQLIKEMLGRRNDT